jgi:hypothetical protein
MAYQKDYGTKYAATKSLDLKEVAKLVRKDIAAAPELKGFKVSVTISRFAGQVGKSMQCAVKSIPPGFKLLRRSRMYREFKNEPNADGGEPFLTDEALAVERQLEAIMGQYNYDRGEIQSDYFDQKFYANVVMPSTQADRDAFYALCASDPGAAGREARGEAVTSKLTVPVQPAPYTVTEAEHKRQLAEIAEERAREATWKVFATDPDTAALLKAKERNQAEFMAAMGCD